MKIDAERKKEIKDQVFDRGNWSVETARKPGKMDEISVSSTYKSKANGDVNYIISTSARYPIMNSDQLITAVLKDINGKCTILGRDIFSTDAALYLVYLSEVSEYENMLPEWYDAGKWKKRDQNICMNLL